MSSKYDIYDFYLFFFYKSKYIWFYIVSVFDLDLALTFYRFSVYTRYVLILLYTFKDSSSY